MIHTTLSTSVLNKYKNPYFFETGTANGDSISLALDLSFEKIFSIEIDPYKQDGNRQKFLSVLNSRVFLYTGDTLLIMKNVVDALDKPTTFWLDAHVDDGICGIKKCPLYDELQIIKSSSLNHTIMIDDLRIITNPHNNKWSEDLDINNIFNLLKNINSNYKFIYEDGIVPKDILVAYLSS